MENFERETCKKIERKIKYKNLKKKCFRKKLTKIFLHLKPKKSLGVKKFEKKVKPGRASPLVAGPAVPRLPAAAPRGPQFHWR